MLSAGPDHLEALLAVQYLLEKNAPNQRIGFWLRNNSGAAIADPTGVTVRRSLDGGAVGACTGTVALFEAGSHVLVFTASAADVNADVGIFVFDHASAENPVAINFRTNDTYSRLLNKRKLNPGVLTGKTKADFDLDDALNAALLTFLGAQTSPDLAVANPTVNVAYPGDGTTIYTFLANSSVGDYLTDRGFTRFRAMTPVQRNLQGVTSTTVDDCLIAAASNGTGNEDISADGTTYTKKTPNGTTMVIFTMSNFTAIPGDPPRTRTRS